MGRPFVSSRWTEEHRDAISPTTSESSPLDAARRERIEYEESVRLSLVAGDERRQRRDSIIERNDGIG